MHMRMRFQTPGRPVRGEDSALVLSVKYGKISVQTRERLNGPGASED